TEFAGKTVKVHMHVLEVSEPVMPEVDGAFIRSFGVKSGDPDQFRTEIRSNLERELKGALMQRLRKEVGEQLIAAYNHVEMPPRLVENEARSMAAGMVEQARPGPELRSRPGPVHGRRAQARAGGAAGR